MTLALQCHPRTGRGFIARVQVNNQPLPPTPAVAVGLRITTGAVTKIDDLDGGSSVNTLLNGEDMLNLRRRGSSWSGMVLIDCGALTHAPGADVKVYALLVDSTDPTSAAAAAVSPGVLLAA